MSCLPACQAFSQEQQPYEEVYINLSVQGIGTVEMPSVIIGQEIWLPVEELFAFLKIRYEVSPDGGSISGFFIHQEATYLISYPEYVIIYKDKTYALSPGDLVLTGNGLYLKSKYYFDIFDLNCKFSFRSLSVSLTTTVELPQVRDQRKEMMRQNIGRLKGEIQADTVIGRTYPGFHFGAADWSFYSTQKVDGICDNRFYLALGSVIAGGEAYIGLNYSTRQPFTEKQQQYFWRFVNNDFKAAKQFIGGKFTTYAASSIYAPVVGAQITNTPSTFRRTYGSYTLSDYTEPGWVVELYVNSVLVDYVTADPSGFFTFEVPLVYGNTDVKLKFYGPWGEERLKEQYISVPFNFVPYKSFEYRISGGMVEDGQNSIYSRADMNYGLSRWLTIGGGMEYLSTVTSGPAMPFLSFSMRPASSLLFTGEYIYGVRTKGLLSYRFPSDLMFEINYSIYDKNQTAINYNYLEERKLTVSMPIRGRHISLFSRLTIDQIILPTSDYTTSELLFSGAINGISTNFSTYALFSRYSEPYIYSRLSLGFHLPARFVITPQAQFEYNNSRFVSAKCELEKYLFAHGYLSLSYEQNFKSDYWTVQLGFRYDLPFAQASFTARNINEEVTLVESARGSLVFDSKSHYAGASNRTNVGKGGIVLKPFLDINCNGERDPGEPATIDLRLSVLGGQVVASQKDTLIRIFNLEPYTSYLVEFDPNSLDNIAWKLPHKSFSIAAAANQFTQVEVPISVVGEASGMVYLESETGRRGQGRILVCFCNEDSVMVNRTLSEPGGYFSYLGLEPGNYYAGIDTSQLHKLNLVNDPTVIPFTIRPDRYGDVVFDLEFMLRQVKKVDTAASTEQPEEIRPQPEEVEEEPKEPEKELDMGRYSIQAGAFGNMERAVSVRDKLEKELGRKLVIDEAEGLFKVLIPGFSNWDEALRYLEKIRPVGYPGAFIRKNK